MISRSLLILTALLLTSLSYGDEHMKVFGNYEVHYSVVNSTFISPEVAKAYGIVRGKDRALINIAVREQLPKGQSKPKRAIVKGSSSDLIHSANLVFDEIQEQQAIYYIAELSFNNRELRTFTINIQPDPNIAAYTLKFSKTLYVEQ